MAVCVRNIAGVDGFLVNACFAYTVECLRNGHVRFKVDIFDGHYAARAVLGVFQNFVDFRTRVGVGLPENTFYNICRHFLYDVNGIVKVHFVKDVVQLIIAECHNKSLLNIWRHLDKGFRRKLFWKEPEKAGYVFLRHFVKHKRNVRRLHFGQGTSQLDKVLFIQQL